jgi:hypothetical protein
MRTSDFVCATLSVPPNYDASRPYRIVEGAKTDSAVYRGKDVSDDLWRNPLTITGAHYFLKFSNPSLVT